MKDYTFTFTIGGMTEDQADDVQVAVVELLLYKFATMTPVDFQEVQAMTPMEALGALIDMGVDRERIARTPFASLPALYDTIMDEVSEYCAERGIE